MKTTVVNVHRERYDVYIGRAGHGQSGYFGNPFPLPRKPTPAELEQCWTKFVEYFERRVEKDPEFRAAVLALRGKRLGCFCKPAKCHGDVIAAWIDAQPEPAP